MVAETKMCRKVWEHKETSLLLEKWGGENIQLQLKSCARKKPNSSVASGVGRPIQSNCNTMVNCNGFTKVRVPFGNRR